MNKVTEAATSPLLFNFVSEELSGVPTIKRRIDIVYDPHWLPYYRQLAPKDYTFGAIFWVQSLDQGVAVFIYGCGNTEISGSVVHDLEELLSILRSVYSVNGDNLITHNAPRSLALTFA